MSDEANAAGGTTPWGEHPLDDDRTTRLAFGPLDVWVRRSGGEVLLAHRENPSATDGEAEAAGDVRPGEPPEDAVRARWAAGGEVEALRFEPAFPDRPLVAKPETPFRIVRGAEARIYVRVPLRVRARLPGSDGSPLTEIPTVTLSNTWFGGFTEGELSYWLPISARRRVDDDLFAPHLAVCPLRLVNRSGEELEVTKLSMRVEYLSVFDADGRLWGDETTVRYMAESEGSRIDIGGEPPEEAGSARRIGEPREEFRAGLRARTFERLRALSPFGIPG